MKIEQLSIYLAVVGTFALPTVLALLVSRLRTYWLFQTLLIVAFLSPMLMIRAFDLMLALSVSSLLVFSLSKIWQGHQKRLIEKTLNDSTDRKRFQIGISNVLSGFVLIAVVATLMIQVSEFESVNLFEPMLSVLQCVFIGIAIGIWGVSVTFFFSSTSGRLKRLWFLVPMVVSLIGAEVARVVLRQHYSVEGFLSIKEIELSFDLLKEDFVEYATVESMKTIFVLSLILLLYAVMVAILFWLGLSWGKNKSKESAGVWRFAIKRTLLVGKSCLAVSLIFLLASPVVFYFVALLPPKPYIPRKPIEAGQPNGIVDLIEAGKALENNRLRGPFLPGPELANYIAAQSRGFELIDEGLRKANLAMIDWGSGTPSSHFHKEWVSTSLDEFGQISVALHLRSLQALSEGRQDDVVGDGLRLLRISESHTNDAIWGTTYRCQTLEGGAVGIVMSGIDSASEDQLELVAAHLDEMAEFSGVTQSSIDLEVADIIDADRSFNWRITNWRGRLADVLSPPTYTGIRDILVRRNVSRSLLRAEIAIQWYQRGHGRYPKNLHSLVGVVPVDWHGDSDPPVYLKYGSIDIYRAETLDRPWPRWVTYKVNDSGTNYKVYSLGLDRDDDNGEINEFEADGHLFRRDGDLDLMAIYGDRLEKHAAWYREHQEFLKRQEALE